MTAESDSPWTVFLAFLRLGLTSFGGPVAHLGYFRAEFVARRHWLDEAQYADIVALSQMLPGPASSKVGIMIGVLRAGIPGALAAWLGFTMPSALALIAFGYGVSALGNLAGAATVLVLAAPSTLGQVGAIVLGGLIGWRLLPGETIALNPLPVRLARGWSIAAIVLFFALLVALPLAAASTGNHLVALFDAFYRSGALVFGGGHVVLPLLQAATVQPGWVGNDAFLAGYGAAQAVPGPLFTFSAYLGTVMGPPPHGWTGGLFCLVAIFLPAFFLAVGPLPFWNWLRTHPAMRSVLKGVNAAVVGLLLAALYNPVWTSAIHGAADFAIAVVAVLLLGPWKVPPWLVVILGAAAASVVAYLA
jgi:chromate transporter